MSVIPPSLSFRSPSRRGRGGRCLRYCQAGGHEEVEYIRNLWRMWNLWRRWVIPLPYLRLRGRGLMPVLLPSPQTLLPLPAFGQLIHDRDLSSGIALPGGVHLRTCHPVSSFARPGNSLSPMDLESPRAPYGMAPATTTSVTPSSRASAPPSPPSNSGSPPRPPFFILPPVLVISPPSPPP